MYLSKVGFDILRNWTASSVVKTESVSILDIPPFISVSDQSNLIYDNSKIDDTDANQNGFDRPELAVKAQKN